MFSVDTLLNIACAHETAITSGLRGDMTGMFDAFYAALYLEAEGIVETNSVGPFHAGIVPGKVKVTKGSPVSSTRKRLARQAGRDYVVMAIGVLCGTVYCESNGRIAVRNSRVMWLSDGYYCSTDVGNVMLVA